MIQKGDMVRVKVAGIFHGQEVKVVNVEGRRLRGKERRAYKLATTWDGMIRASFFSEEEIELIKQEGVIS